MTRMLFCRLVLVIILILKLSLVSPQSNTGLHADHTCGVSHSPLRPRIIGGEESNFNQWPWLAAIFLRYAPLGPHIIMTIVGCGGVVISSRHILTAAHCVQLENNSNSVGPITPGGVQLKPENEFLVRLGDHDIISKADSVSPIEYRVAQVFAHDHYSKITFVNDIAILKLAEEIRFNAGIQPICVPTADMAKETFNRHQAYVAGWGTIKQGMIGSNNAVRHVQIAISSNKLCQQIFPETHIYKTKLCAGEILGGKDACQGDSGGPLMIPWKGQWYTIGIISTGIKCAVPGYLGMYTRVTEFLSWIHYTMML